MRRELGYAVDNGGRNCSTFGGPRLCGRDWTLFRASHFLPPRPGPADTPRRRRCPPCHERQHGMRPGEQSARGWPFESGRHTTGSASPDRNMPVTALEPFRGSGTAHCSSRDTHCCILNPLLSVHWSFLRAALYTDPTTLLVRECGRIATPHKAWGLRSMPEVDTARSPPNASHTTAAQDSMCL
ncbi:hypothetical protein CALCODRAFT_320987 [Calocera cornea HHB12733]|uniref:Uncharacterized protein n=1 Tax=Calocera cornea HHB12733 TaxID=1353952 RepID=A0A165F5Y6_9BASI|nr:hypothetical protein CALCODRAFT_320987 [Calocera cornea HHB12733]